MWKEGTLENSDIYKIIIEMNLLDILNLKNWRLYFIRGY